MYEQMNKTRGPSALLRYLSVANYYQDYKKTMQRQRENVGRRRNMNMWHAPQENALCFKTIWRGSV